MNEEDKVFALVSADIDQLVAETAEMMREVAVKNQCNMSDVIKAIAMFEEQENNMMVKFGFCDMTINCFHIGLERVAASLRQRIDQ